MGTLPVLLKVGLTKLRYKSISDECHFAKFKWSNILILKPLPFTGGVLNNANLNNPNNSSKARNFQGPMT